MLAVARQAGAGRHGRAWDRGADEVVVSRSASPMAVHAGSIDFILNTVAAAHDLDAFLVLLKRDGTMPLVGAPPPRILCRR